jgi:pyruvate,water dikinase
MTWIIHKHEPVAEVARAGGGKAANLAVLSQRGLNVPAWFCIGAGAFDRFIAANGLERAIALPADLGKGDLAACAARIEKVFVAGAVPAEIVDSIRTALPTIGADEESYLAVRSSGLDEDSALHSFAGQFSSYLFQQGEAGILECLKRCWASGYSERALAYRIARGICSDRVRMAVVVQRMVDAESAGVAFSRNPMRPLDRNTVVVSSAWGLGEGVVSGKLDADYFEVHRETRQIRSHAAAKEHALRRDARGGLRRERLPDALRAAVSLDETQVREVTDLAVGLERALGAPQDCEWAYAGGSLFVLQTRPITSLPPDGLYDARVSGDRPALWDNSNIIESFCGVTSPLTFSHASRAYRQVYVQFCEVMGVPEKVVADHDHVFRNMLGLIRGRIYYNLGCWYRMLFLFPGATSSKGFMETMMGVKQRLGAEHAKLFAFTSDPPRYSAWRRARLLATTLVRILRIRTIISDFKRRFDTVYEKSRHEDFEALSLQEQIDYYHWLERELLQRWKAPIVNDTRCMVFFGLLDALTRKWLDAGERGASLQAQLLSGQGDLASAAPTRALMRIAAAIDGGDPVFREWFVSTPARELWTRLPARSAAIQAAYLEFLDQYGFRCANELKLEEADLHEDPTFAIDAVASFVRARNHSIEAMEARRRAIRADSERIVGEKLPWPRRLVYNFILARARRAVLDREDLRFIRTNGFGVTRRLFRAIGVNLHKLGLIAGPRDVFFLTMDEIVAFAEGRSLVLDFRGLVEVRTREFQEYRDTPPPPDRFVTVGASGMYLRDPRSLADADLLRSDRPSSDDPNVLVGTPCCPGIVEGVARVARTPADARGLNGEILVTERTDPGWVPLFPSAAGLLVERGSPLSHSAVVARELGISTIVGISGGLMERLATGQRVHMDAGRGEVRIL